MQTDKNIQNEDFEIVGICKQRVRLEKKEKTEKNILKGKPVISFTILFLIISGCVFAPLICNKNPGEFYLKNLNNPPSSEFYFGTDSLGRDIFSMIWYGGRKSVFIGVLSTIILSFVGIVYGCISAMSTDRIDTLMMRFAELMGSIPNILLVLMLVAISGKQNVFKISAVIGISSWFSLARLVRSEVLQIKSSEYVISAKLMGCPFYTVLLRHLIPNFMSSVMFVIISSVSSSMTMESTLSFLGMGLPVNVITWGSMLSLANKALLFNTWWVIIIPGIFLVATLLCITNLGNFLRKEVNKKPGNLQ